MFVIAVHSALSAPTDYLLQLFVIFQGQAVAQLCSTVPNVTVFGIASCFKHAAIKDSVTHLFDRNVDYVQEVKKYEWKFSLYCGSS